MKWITLLEALVVAGANREQLVDALLAGDVKGRWRSDDRTAHTLQPGAWRDEIDWERSRLNYRSIVIIPLNGERHPQPPNFVPVEIDQQTLLDQFKGTHQAARYKVGGRPRKWDWEEFWLELCARLYEDGLSETQAEMVKRMGQWFVNQQSDQPAESEIKKRVSRLWRRLGRG